MTTNQDWNYFSKDPEYSDLLRRRLADGVEMDSAKALAAYMEKHLSGDLRILDFGSGPGHYWPVIESRYKNGALSYLGVDIDEANIRFGSGHFCGDPRVQLRLGSVLEPGAIAGLDEINTVVSANTLPHVPTIVPLLRWLADNSNVRAFVFRMLVGAECVQIKKHLREHDYDAIFERDFQFNNIYSTAFLEKNLGTSWRLECEPDVFDLARLQQHRVPRQREGDDEFYGHRVSRAVDGLTFKGEIYMPWKFVIGKRV